MFDNHGIQKHRRNSEWRSISIKQANLRKVETLINTLGKIRYNSGAFRILKDESRLHIRSRSMNVDLMDTSSHTGKKRINIISNRIC